MPRLRKVAEFAKRTAPKMSEGLRIIGRVARENVAPRAAEGARRLLTFSRENVAPRVESSARVAAYFARQSLKPAVKKNAAILLALMRRAAARTMVAKEMGIPAARSAATRTAKLVRERAIPTAWHVAKNELAPRMVVAGKEVRNLIVERVATAGKRGWERDVARLSARTGIDERTLKKMLHHVAKETTLERAKQILEKTHGAIHATGGKELARAMAGEIMAAVRAGVAPVRAHQMALEALKATKNPGQIKEIIEEYRRLRSREFVQKVAEPPSKNVLQALLSQHPVQTGGPW